MTTKTKEVSTESTETTTGTRKVTIWSTQERSTQTIETSAKTWGELKSELPNTGNSRAVIRETRNTLESGGAQLPNQDFTLFLYPEKVRSGRTVKVHKVEEAEWDNSVDTLVMDQVKEYKEEFEELIATLAPKIPTKAETQAVQKNTKLAQEAEALAAELGI